MHFLHYVIGFAAMHDPADVIQDVGREDRHHDRGNGQQHGAAVNARVVGAKTRLEIAKHGMKG